jgi:cobalt-zinc-cadmium resistance protein CzcA
MANYGLNIEDVNNALSTAFAGQTAGQVFENERRFDLVYVWTVSTEPILMM